MGITIESLTFSMAAAMLNSTISPRASFGIGKPPATNTLGLLCRAPGSLELTGDQKAMLPFPNVDALLDMKNHDRPPRVSSDWLFNPFDKTRIDDHNETYVSDPAGKLLSFGFEWFKDDTRTIAALDAVAAAVSTLIGEPFSGKGVLIALGDSLCEQRVDMDACEANKQNYLHMMRPAFYDEGALDDMEAQWARLQEGKKKSDGITPVSPWGKELMTWGNHAKKKGVGPYCIPVEVDNENEGEISRVGKEHWLTVAGLKHLLFTVLKGGEVELTPDLHWVMKQMLRAYFLERETLLSLKATERTKEQERRAGELLALASSTESALQFVCKLLRQVFAVGKKHSMTQDVLQTMETLKAQRDLEECTSSVNAVARQIADLMGKMPVASAPASEKKAKKPVPESSPFWSNLATLAHRTKLQELLCTESSSPDSPPLPASALANFIEAKMVAIRPIGFRCLARIEAFLKAAGPKLNNLEGGNSVTKKEYAKVDGNLNQARAMMRPLRDEPALARLRRCLERLKPLIGPAAKGQTAALTTLKAEISAAGKRLNGRDKTEADG